MNFALLGGVQEGSSQCCIGFSSCCPRYVLRRHESQSHSPVDGGCFCSARVLLAPMSRESVSREPDRVAQGGRTAAGKA